MQKNILQKCLDELNKTPFKIDKVIGMLETLIEMDNSSTPYVPSYPIISPPSIPMPYYPVTVTSTASVLSDEERLAQKYNGGPIGELQ